jgi:hypothetical protein
MKKIIYIFIFLLVLVPFITIYAQTSINGIPGTTLLSGEGPCTDEDPRKCYQFLEPLPVTDESGRDAVATAIVVDPEEGSIGKSFNNFYYMAIGIGSVLAVIMIVMYGFRYMTGDQGGYNKQKLKDKITNTVLGILLLLGIYIILNTINPQLLEVNPEIGPATLSALTIQEDYTYTSSSGNTIKVPKGGKIPIEELCPIVTQASQKTGLDKYFILAILWQETKFGSQQGRCNYKDSMKPDWRGTFETIMRNLGKDPTTVGVSCKSTGSTWGGAMGVAQIIPPTWSEYADRAKNIAGKAVKDPWSINDAIFVQSAILAYKKNGNEYDRACAYFGSCGSNFRLSSGKTYGTEVLEWKNGLAKEAKCT